MSLEARDQPCNWSKWRKWFYITLVSYCDFLTILVSMMLAPSVPQVLEEFRPNGDDKSLGSFSVTVYILGFCTGPMVIAPLTDIHGRTFIFRTSSLFFLALTLACAFSPSLEALIAFRFFAGCFGGAPMAIGGAVISDMYSPGERDTPLALYAAGTMMGPTLGPVFGGLITGHLGWRWLFRIAAILAGAGTLGLCVLPETHMPTLVRRARLRGRRPKEAPHAETNAQVNDHGIMQTLGRAASLPIRVACHVPTFLILLLICIYNGLVNMILSSLGSVYQDAYGFPATTCGLAYLGIGLGGLTSLAATRTMKQAISSASLSSRLSKGKSASLFLAAMLPVSAVGLLWYGWAVESRVGWFVPIPGLYLFGFGWMTTRLSTQVFLIEAVPNYIASALAAHTVASSVGGALIPLVTFPVYDHVGYGWGNTIAAMVNLGLCLIPLSTVVVSSKRPERRQTAGQAPGPRAAGGDGS